MLYPKDFYFIRHGETDWNRERRGMGQQDIPLNATGILQVEAAVEKLHELPIELICHSPLKRAQKTAEIIANRLELPLLNVPELIECSWGICEGKPKGKWLEDWVNGSEIEGAASYRSFIDRAVRGINEALKNKEQHILIVSHGGVFWAVQEFARLGENIELPNARPVFLKAPTEAEDAWTCTSL